MKVVAFDRDTQPLERPAVDGVKTAANARATVIGSDIIFLSLPSGEIVHQICQDPEGLLACIQRGQIVKILNNMVVFETTVAISEAKLIGERSGLDPALLFDTLSKGSADSFVLRNHGMKSVMTCDFPERSFSVEYARKDLNYALQLAQSTGVDARGAKVVSGWFEEAIEKGDGEKYHSVISRWMATS